MTNYRITLGYDGTDYHGWQLQPGLRTIQGEVEKALAVITHKRVPVNGAGRTDAGVHALAQTAGFRADLRLGTDELLRALNAVLPDDIRVFSAEEAPADFHPRKSALSKTYRYRICISPVLSPFIRRYVIHRPMPLDFEAMREASGLFVREDDFSTFSSNKDKCPVRKVIRSEIVRKNDEIQYTVTAEGFLKYMVRTMAGTLLNVGRGRIRPSDIEGLFRKKARTLGAPTAPAKGLCLVEVAYPPNFSIMTSASSGGRE
jgi:tRNA pseudouridine38-40 synthase